MTDKRKITYKGEEIKVTQTIAYWELEFSDGSSKKLYHHVNAADHAVWMWESGTIDEASLAIGRLIFEKKS